MPGWIMEQLTSRLNSAGTKPAPALWMRPTSWLAPRSLTSPWPLKAVQWRPALGSDWHRWVLLHQDRMDAAGSALSLCGRTGARRRSASERCRFMSGMTLLQH